MISVPTLAHLVAARNMRRLLSCGCLATIALISLPVLVLLSVMNNLVPSVNVSSANQVDGANGVVVGTAQPLAPGRFTVSQGFGCTAVAAEPVPAPGYTCPPDAGHAGYRRFHTGIDLAAPSGLTVFAVVDGTVRVIESAVGFGVHIMLTPSQAQSAAVVYIYGHLSEVAVPNGDVVRAGDPIGYVGSTGNSSGPHLHFEVDVAGVPVNPCSSFPRGYLVPAGVAAAGCLAWAT